MNPSERGTYSLAALRIIPAPRLTSGPARAETRKRAGASPVAAAILTQTSQSQTTSIAATAGYRQLTSSGPEPLSVGVAEICDAQR